MAKSGEKKGKKVSNPAFSKYKEFIASHPAYSGMPDLRYPDGRIQWETPSNRKSGEFKDSHDKRLQWWKNKAAEIGISTTEDKWISKVAKRIHPTGIRPCPVCGKELEIRYAYLSKRFIKRVHLLDFYNNDIEMTEITHILDFVTEFITEYKNHAIHTLPILLSCKEAPDIPKLSTLSEWLEWIDQKYIPLEPSMLGPGSMSNAPDRLDGFHYNRCCRKKTDKGRSDANLASYSKDRRAFENWSDGNWITANMLMGYIKSNPALRQEPCANFGDAHEHPLPCDADHIGPISLGFCHRPEFQLLCSPCNSAKNNRLYFSDVQHLIAVESTGETVTTWYATPVWNLCKNKVTNAETALRLSKIMRDNRNIALMLLSKFMTSGECLFLLSLLNLQYADYQYQIIPDSQEIYNHIVTVDFTYETSSLRYVTIQKRRKIRIAFESLSDYATKDNRNGFIYNSPTIEQLKSTIFDILSSVPQEYKILNSKLCSIISNPVISDNEIESFLNEVDYNKLLSLNEYVAAKEKLYEIMSLVAQELSNNWDSARYSREIEE
ncbi:Alw26I/Eco31I/Esp3I family type II restriction endonuclease [Blautia obeum]|uniref:Alw26I/Eco31I/Esp3I family type II restriction endonuclease n=1 Tax=Blautia obeum TaxID=40520 RepID=UPI000E4E1ADF|nr:Alw26I/Eco31I/Esp3I family type II restriction endonuclease [Blautia obeum]RHM31555.1 Alw26I/Eco31I/Esp3I family type II restriction endonuclease [Blautia obeum]